MRVSARHAFAIASTALMALCVAPASAGAGGDGGGGGNCCTPPPPPTPCCQHGGGHTVNVPNINVHGGNINVGVNVSSRVNVTTNVNTTVNANAQAGAAARSNAGATTIVGGSYANYATAPAATAITGLNVVGLEEEHEWEWYEEERTRWIEEWRVVRAVCVDDGGTPHPASRVDGDLRVGQTFDGEIFRCMAGTAMQATIGWRVDGHDSWEDAPTIMCRKGEALRHTPGGELRCVTQIPQRNCNERSLLRMHGPGVKLVFMRREEVYTERMRREIQRERVERVSMTLMLDGGVGGYR